MIAGIVIFGEVFPWLEAFYFSTSFGTFTLSQAFGLSHGATVFLIITVAIGGFALAERIESRYGYDPKPTES